MSLLNSIVGQLLIARICRTEAVTMAELDLEPGGGLLKLIYITYK